MRIYGVPCDRPTCQRVVALVEPYCCLPCKQGEGHTEACGRRQEAWSQGRGNQESTTQTELAL